LCVQEFFVEIFFVTIFTAFKSPQTCSLKPPKVTILQKKFTRVAYGCKQIELP
jgi:hypothetical protein